MSEFEPNDNNIFPKFVTILTQNNTRTKERIEYRLTYYKDVPIQIICCMCSETILWLHIPQYNLEFDNVPCGISDYNKWLELNLLTYSFKDRCCN